MMMLTWYHCPSLKRNEYEKSFLTLQIWRPNKREIGSECIYIFFKKKKYALLNYIICFFFYLLFVDVRTLVLKKIRQSFMYLLQAFCSSLDIIWTKFMCTTLLNCGMCYTNEFPYVFFIVSNVPKCCIN